MTTAPRPNQPAPGTKLIRFDELEETDAKGFTFGEGKELFRCFVVRWMGGVFGYINECPHVRTPLDWRPDQFFNMKKTSLQCGTHGALFTPHDGLCYIGPCKNRAIPAFPVKLIEGWVVVA